MRTRRDFLKSMALASLAAGWPRGDQLPPGQQHLPAENPSCLPPVSCKAPHPQNEDPHQYICVPSDGGLYQKEKLPVPEPAGRC